MGFRDFRHFFFGGGGGGGGGSGFRVSGLGSLSRGGGDEGKP